MAELPADVGTGTIHITIAQVGPISSLDTQSDVSPASGRVLFTPSASMLRHLGTGVMYPPAPVSAYLDAQGQASVTLMATNDPQITPVDWTYKVTFELEDLSIASFHVDVPEGSERNLAEMSPVQDDTGEYYIVTGPPGPVGPASTVPGPTGPQGPQGTVDSAAVANVLGVTLVVSDTVPSSPTLYGKPVVWITNGSLLTPVPVTPTAPTFNYATYVVSCPSMVGVEYQFYDPTAAGGTWLPIPSGDTSLAGFTRPFMAKVRAVAKPGYTVTASYEWNALFYTESALTLWASDGFSGTANTYLCPANNGTGRSVDMAGGGSATGGGIPKWTYNHPTIASGWMLNGSGVAVRNSADGAADYHNGNVHMVIGATNWRVEIDVVAPWVGAHGRNFTIGAGSVVMNIAMTVPNTSIDLNACGPVTLSQNPYGPVSSVQYTGTWKFAYINKCVQVTTADGRTFSKDYNAASDANRGATDKLVLSWGDWSGANPGQAAPMDAIRIYK